MQKYSIFEIADWFLVKAPMTPKKLQKLSYYAQAWSNALMHQDLIEDTDFEAWQHGPVAPKLYAKYKDYGWTMIPAVEEAVTIKDEAALNLLESVWITYGDKSANELEALTHQEMPWQKARQGLAPDEGSNNVIDVEDMRNYYLSIYAGD